MFISPYIVSYESRSCFHFTRVPWAHLSNLLNERKKALKNEYECLGFFFFFNESNTITDFKSYLFKVAFKIYSWLGLLAKSLKQSIESVSFGKSR